MIKLREFISLAIIILPVLLVGLFLSIKLGKLIFIMPIALLMVLLSGILLGKVLKMRTL